MMPLRASQVTVITTALALAEELLPGLWITSGPRPPWRIKSLVVGPELEVSQRDWEAGLASNAGNFAEAAGVLELLL